MEEELQALLQEDEEEASKKSTIINKKAKAKQDAGGPALPHAGAGKVLAAPKAEAGDSDEDILKDLMEV